MARQRTRSSSRSILVVLVGAGLFCLAGCGNQPHAEKKSQAGAQYSFWPLFPDEPRVQFVRALDSSNDVAPSEGSALEKIVLGKDAPKAAEINKPYGLAMRDGKIYVCDIRSGCLAVMDLKKKQTRLVGITGLNQLKRPVAVAVADDGMIYVADNDRGAIFVYDQAERFSRIIGRSGLKPAGIAVYGDRVYVSDTKSQIVEIFSRSDGKALGTIGSVGDGDGQFRLPLGVATDTKGNIYISDMMRCRVQKFDPDGKFLGGFGALGDYAGSFARPKHIAVDADGIIYVVDAAFQNIQMFDDKFQLLMHFGTPGDFPGATNLPAGICISEGGIDLVQNKLHPGFQAKRLIVISNQFGNAKVGLYALGGCREGYTAKDLAAAAAPVASGVTVPDAERLKLQAPGTDEPPPAEGEGSKAAEPTGAAPGIAPAPTPAEPRKPAEPK